MSSALKIVKNMSTPLNHHFVSECHSRQFFNEEEKRIYCYDKTQDRFYSKITTKSLFSEYYSNTRVQNGELDHSSLEEELNRVFETDFTKHLANILQLVSDPASNDETKLESLYHMATFALIGDIRSPYHKDKADQLVDTMFKDISGKVKGYGDDIKANAILKSIEKDPSLKHSNLLNYTDVAIRRLQRMGDLDFKIVSITSLDCFLLPDTGSYQQRERINNYTNPYIQEIAIVGIPLTDKIYIDVDSGPC